MDSLRRELGEARTALAAQFRMIDELSGDASQPRGELYQVDGVGNLDPLDEMRERHARWRERDKTFDALAAQLRHISETVAEDPEFTTAPSPLSAAQAQREASSVTTSPPRTTSALDDGRPAGQSVRALLTEPARRLRESAIPFYGQASPGGSPVEINATGGLASRGELSVWRVHRRVAQSRFPAGAPSELAHGPPFIQAEAPTADRFSSDTVAGSVISWEVCSQRHGLGSPRLDWDLRLVRRGL